MSTVQLQHAIYHSPPQVVGRDSRNDFYRNKRDKRDAKLREIEWKMGRTTSSKRQTMDRLLGRANGVSGRGQTCTSKSWNASGARADRQKNQEKIKKSWDGYLEERRRKAESWDAVERRKLLGMWMARLSVCERELSREICCFIRYTNSFL